MNNRILRAMSNMPPGGIALHGTTHQKALSIAKWGLIGSKYVTLVPNPDSPFFRSRWNNARLYNGALLPNLGPSEFFSRALGSILFSTSYSFSQKHEKSPSNPTGEVNPQPAIIIFAKWEKGIYFNWLGDDFEVPFTRQWPNFDSKTYFSFGKINYGPRPDEVCAIASLSRREMSGFEARAHVRAGSDPILYEFSLRRSFRDGLALKTLQLIERLTFLESKPCQILFL